MTKTLTEKWREGKLRDGWYYLDYDTQEMKVEIKDGRMYMDGIIVNMHSYGDDIELMSIKGSVPSYSEFQAWKDNCELTHLRLKGAHQKITQLEKKLVIATKALDHCQGFDFVRQALKEIEEVKCYSARICIKEGVK